MTTSGAASDVRDEQFALLTTPIGTRASGHIRYGAAMFFYMRGEINADMLEIYRRCCVLDAEDPIDLARYEGVVVTQPAAPKE